MAPGAGAITHGAGEGKGGRRPRAPFEPPSEPAAKATKTMPKQTDRDSRLAAALRANLKRRKDRARDLAGRKAEPPQSDRNPGASEPVAGQRPHPRPNPARKPD
jgi:hypothetical protein